MTKRSKLEMYLDVLRAISRGINKPTRIMNICNLSWNNFQFIMDFFVRERWVIVERKGKRVLYNLTQMGQELVTYVNSRYEKDIPHPFLIIEVKKQTRDSHR